MPALGLFKAGASAPTPTGATAGAAMESERDAPGPTPPSSGGKYRPSRLWRKGSEARGAAGAAPGSASDALTTGSSAASAFGGFGGSGSGGGGIFAEQQERRALWDGEDEAETVVILGPASERRSAKIAEDRDALLDSDHDGGGSTGRPAGPSSPSNVSMSLFDPFTVLRPVTPPPQTGYATALSPPRRPLPLASPRSPPRTSTALPLAPAQFALPLAPAPARTASPSLASSSPRSRRPRASSLSRPPSSRASSPTSSSADEPARRREETAAWLARKPSGRFRRASSAAPSPAGSGAGAAAATAAPYASPARRLDPPAMLQQPSGSSVDDSASEHRLVRGYEVEVTCEDRRVGAGDGGDADEASTGEMRWSIVVRPGAVGAPAAAGPVHVSTTGSIALAPRAASSINLSLSLDQPTGKLVFVAFPMDLGATPTRARPTPPVPPAARPRSPPGRPATPELPPPPPSPRSPRSPRTPAYKRQGGVWSPTPARADADLFTPTAGLSRRAGLLADMDAVSLNES